MKQRFQPLAWAALIVTALGGALLAAEPTGGAGFHRQVEPILKEYCHDCHADGAHKGGVAFDEFTSDQALLENRELWWKALKNLRAGLMPPGKKPQPSAIQKQSIEHWIKSSVFQVDPAHPDPGRVTVRRLNRTEYHNTIKDLLGIDFDTQAEFPPDDSGHGFDNIGDALTLPPMLLEKYLTAARTIVSKAVPTAAGVPAEVVVPGRSFRKGIAVGPGLTNSGAMPASTTPSSSLSSLALSYYEKASVSNTFRADHDGGYQVLLDLTANEKFIDNQFDYNKCRLIFRVDGGELHRQEYTRENGRALHYEFDRRLTAGAHELILEVEPLTPDQKQVRSLSMRLDSVTVRGPLEPEHWVKPANYARYFPKDPPPGDMERRRYAGEVLRPFVEKAYRRPVDSETVDRLVRLAESAYGQPGKTFEAGIGQAMTAVLASPRFLFREEAAEPTPRAQVYPTVDEYALASRLSYFFWSSMPDDELIRLAGQKNLRKHLPGQVNRLMADARFNGFIRNFTGQWLQTRDIESVSIDSRQVLARENTPDPDAEKNGARFRELFNKPEESLTDGEKKELADARVAFRKRTATPLRAEMTGDLRRAMRQETEKTLEYILREDRSLIELLDSDYTFLNERLAKHYGLTNLNVVGDEVRRVSLPPQSARGGILTQGSVLAVTSNPTRTSPVKRGLFILDNLLGTPPAPPPPDVTPLEDAAKGIKGRTVSLRETLALHREKPLCSSCHNRMDPLGLALENFNAMGMFRETERGLPVDVTGKLLSGEEFANVGELKHILATRHAREFYHTVTEKMLTYALGRGLEYYDVETVDQIVDRLVKAEGRPSALFAGIVGSAPFQKMRANHSPESSPPSKPAKQRADARSQP